MFRNNKYYYLFLTFLFVPFYGADASPACSEWLAKVISVQGQVDTQTSGQSDWQTVNQNGVFCDGDKIRTSKHSRVTIQMSNQSRMTLDQKTTMVFKGAVKKSASWVIEMLKGSAFFRSRKPQKLNVETPFINAVHEGTEFLVNVNSQQTEITVFDGQVAATNQLSKIQIKKGFAGIATKNQPPKIKKLTVRPENAVQWTLYYPPIINLQNKGRSELKNNSLESIQKAIALLNNNQSLQKDTHFLSYLASRLLSVGSINEAEKRINQIQALEPDNSDATALQAMIAVTKNQQNKAFNLAQKSVNLNPKSATAQIALSYAYQSQFKIELALETTQKAVNLAPDNALAWARLAELQLSTGERSDALESAKKAEQLNPKLDRTQTILGFSYLAQTDVDQAKTAFNNAIHLNSADPLARLGLGLAKIRQGDVEEGTDDLETAVSLDPSSAIFRSYLGKGYYELKKPDYSETELAIGKEQDSKNPTPWFYDAILKQTTNRPVQALQSMQQAIEKNDNRAVYRSRLLLDDDLAARSASLGRIYNDLGFQQRGLVEGWKSVNESPSNYSAHRLLADNYSSLRRHEAARVSELLQSQLLQPTNITPIQPRLAESNLLILDGLGPSSSSFNEFNPLFAKNRLGLQVSGLVGGNNTYVDEVVQSGLWNNFSYSVGQYHYETDGYRANNDLEQDIYSGFMQYQITPKFSAQVEGRYNEYESGDLAMRFRSSIEDSEQRSSSRNYMGRLGLHYQPIRNNHFLASIIYRDNHHQTFEGKEKEDRLIPLDTITDKSYTAEGQYLFESNRINVIVGGGTIHNNSVDNSDDISEEHSNGYIYTYIKLWHNLITTFGLSFDSFQTLDYQRNQLNPKIGVNWQITPSTLIRLAAFQTVKRPSAASNQTIEPTQVAGFNQFFDDFNGAKTKRLGVSIDQKINQSTFAGLEISSRELDYPEYSESGFDKMKTTREQLYRTYFLWAPFDSISLKANYIYERTRSFADTQRPNIIKTHRASLAINYFHPKGFFSKMSAMFVEQNVKYKSNAYIPPLPGNNHFWIVDATIGYRLPNRWGVASLGIKNLLNEQFDFEDLSSQNEEPLTTQFQPGRVLFGQITLSF